MTKFRSFSEYAGEHANLLDSLDNQELMNGVKAIRRAFQEGKTLFSAGNGGSASTASHAVCDLGKGVFQATNMQCKAFALNDMAATLSAWENDTSHQDALANMLKTYGSPGDCLLAISGSGNSMNVVNAASMARKLGITVVSLTGFSGGLLRELGDVRIHVDNYDMQIVENLHLMIVHWFFKELGMNL